MYKTILYIRQFGRWRGVVAQMYTFSSVKKAKEFWDFPGAPKVVVFLCQPT